MSDADDARAKRLDHAAAFIERMQARGAVAVTVGDVTVEFAATTPAPVAPRIRGDDLPPEDPNEAAKWHRRKMEELQYGSS